MLFNSIDFAVFLPVVFLLYWIVFPRNINLRNLLIVAASYVFYGWWDWRFLGLIFLSTLVDYAVGRGLESPGRPMRRKALLWTSILTNLGLLGFFKYYNFFAENFARAFTFFGAEINLASLHIILPVGISFYTFQTLSYTIDIYRGKIKPTRNFIAFSAFVSFFPQLVAGPVERASNLLPQFFTVKKFDYKEATDGLRQILWGLFKKIVIADNCAGFANQIFDHSEQFSGSTLLLGAVFFAFQIYGDFSGYSDIAIGTARLFGFSLMRNFAYPYFSRDMAEFWRRWHISLSTWFRDYVYIPLGGSRGSTWVKVRNTFVIFIVSGFWHGANWTFVAWGALNALYFLPLLLSKKHRDHIRIVASGRRLPAIKDALKMGLTFMLTVFAWIFFRAESVSHAFGYISGIASQSLFSLPYFEGRAEALTLVLLIVFFMWMEWRGREEQFAIAKPVLPRTRLLRWLIYAFLIFLTGLFMPTEETPFIYFQF